MAWNLGATSGERVLAMYTARSIPRSRVTCQTSPCLMPRIRKSETMPSPTQSIQGVPSSEPPHEPAAS